MTLAQNEDFGIISKLREGDIADSCGTNQIIRNAAESLFMIKPRFIMHSYYC